MVCADLLSGLVVEVERRASYAVLNQLPGVPRSLSQERTSSGQEFLEDSLQ